MSERVVYNQKLINKFQTLQIAIMNYEFNNSSQNDFWYEVNVRVRNEINEYNTNVCKQNARTDTHAHNYTTTKCCMSIEPSLHDIFKDFYPKVNCLLQDQLKILKDIYDQIDFIIYQLNRMSYEVINPNVYDNLIRDFIIKFNEVKENINKVKEDAVKFFKEVGATPFVMSRATPRTTRPTRAIEPRGLNMNECNCYNCANSAGTCFYRQGGKRNNKYMRKGPNASATKFKLGIKKRGNDGNIWKIVKNKRGIKRWQKTIDKKHRSKRNKTKKNKTKKNKCYAKLVNKYKKTIGILKTHIKKELKKIGIKTFIVKNSMADNGIYFSDYPWAIVREKYNVDIGDHKFIIVEIHVDNSNKIDTNRIKQITILHTGDFNKKKAKLMEIFKKKFGKKYIWNGNNKDKMYVKL